MRNVLAGCWAAMLLLAQTGWVYAGTPPALAVGNASGPAGSTRSLSFVIDAGSSNLGGVQLEMSVPAQLVVDPDSASGPGGRVGVVCSAPGGSDLICLVFDVLSNPLPPQVVLTVDFRVVAAASAATVPLNLGQVEFSEPSGTVISGTTSNGFFQIVDVGPAVLAATPVVGSEIGWGNVVHGSAQSRSVQVDNVAAPDFLALTINSCSVAGSPAWTLLQPASLPVQVPAGGRTQLEVRMNSTSALPEEVTGVLACSLHDGLAPFSASWPLRATAVPDPLLRDGFE